MVESTWTEYMGQFLYHPDPDTKKIKRRLEKIKLKIINSVPSSLRKLSRIITCFNIHIYIYIYIYKYMYMYIYTCICIYIYVYMYAYICMYICICIYICIHIFVYICIYIYIYVCVCIHVCVCVNIYMHIYICIFQNEFVHKEIDIVLRIIPFLHIVCFQFVPFFREHLMFFFRVWYRFI